jgi:predicted Ser/Thr protein kinase
VATEQEILARAVQAGLLSSDELEVLEAQLASDPTASDFDGRYGARLDALLRSARLDEATVRRLASGPADQASAPPPPAAQLGRYQLEALVGAGGNGRVFKAWDRDLHRPVALKLLRGDRGSAAGLLDEARAQARLDHPNVCPIYEVGELEGQPYIAMQFIAGRTFKEALPELPLHRRLQILEEVARAVHEAHRLGLIHRDLKPSNFMLEEVEGRIRPYVLDFGLARPLTPPLSLDASGAGTPGYMAPEQHRGGANLDARTDVYGLGATLFQLLTGHRPGPEPHLEILPSSVPRDLAAIAARALAPSPDDRYPTAEALAEELARFRRGDPVEARRGGRVYRLGKRLRQHPITGAAITFGIISLLIAAASWGLGLERSRRRAEFAARLGDEVARLEVSRRSSLTSPLHDVALDEDRQRRRLAELEGLVAEHTDDADGAGDYARGRAHAVLGDLSAAFEHLEAARKKGLDTPALSTALGEVMGDLYGQALDELGPKGSAEERGALARTWRTPALAHLKQVAANEPELNRLINARIALYEEQFDLARAEVAASIGEPWRVEAPLLLGRIEDQAGRADRNRGEPQVAWEAHQRAVLAFTEAIRLAASHPDAHQGRCRALVNQLFLEVYDLDRDPGPTHGEAVEACQTATLVHSRRARPWQELARAHRLYATHLHGTGAASAGLIDQAILAGERAVALQPESAEPYDALGNVYRLRGSQRSQVEADNDADLKRAIELFEQALLRKPNGAAIWNDLGNGHAARAAVALTRGAPDFQAYAAAIEAYERSISVQGGTHPSPWINLGALHLDQAQVLEEPERTLLIESALADLQAGLQLHKSDPYALALWAQAAAQQARTLDDPSWLARARTAAERAKALDPASWHGEVALAMIAEAEADLQVATAHDPGDALLASHRAWQRALALNPQQPELRRGEAESWARLQSSGRFSPKASIQR